MFLLRLVRCLFIGFFLAWISVDMATTQLEMMINSPIEEYMARDLHYGYESARALSWYLPRLAAFNFVVGIVVGAFTKPGGIKI
jgi:hypothetical protein